MVSAVESIVSACKGDDDLRGRLFHTVGYTPERNQTFGSGPLAVAPIAELETIVATAGDSEEAMRNTLSSESAHESIRSSLVNRQVMTRLLEIAGAAAPESETRTTNEDTAEELSLIHI